MSKTLWTIKDQNPPGSYGDQGDAEVELMIGGGVVDSIEVRLAHDATCGLAFTFTEALELKAALKAALKEWTRRGVV